MKLTTKDLTFVIPHAGYTKLKRSLETVRKYAPESKIILIDQTPHGAFSDLSDQRYLTDVYVWVYRLLGFSKAMNMGIDMVTTKYVCCMNDDVELIHENWWLAVVASFAKYAADKRPVIAVNPASVKGYKGEPDHLPYKENYTDGDWDYLVSKRMYPNNPDKELVNPNWVYDGMMTWCTIFNMEALREIKRNDVYFDEKFYPGGGEDYDLMCRIYDEGYRAISIFTSWAYHHWFSTRIHGKQNLNIDKNLVWNDVDGKWAPPKGVQIFDKHNKLKNTNWDLWGRHNKDIPAPPCVRHDL